MKHALSGSISSIDLSQSVTDALSFRVIGDHGIMTPSLDLLSLFHDNVTLCVNPPPARSVYLCHGVAVVRSHVGGTSIFFVRSAVGDFERHKPGVVCMLPERYHATLHSCLGVSRVSWLRLTHMHRLYI